jgi:hypothetical protein
VSVLDATVDVGELGIALSDVDDRGQYRRPAGGAEQMADVGEDGGDVTLERSGVRDPMDLASIRMITDDLERVVQFYEQVTGVTAERYTPVFAELIMPVLHPGDRPYPDDGAVRDPIPRAPPTTTPSSSSSASTMSTASTSGSSHW